MINDQIFKILSKNATDIQKTKEISECIEQAIDRAQYKMWQEQQTNRDSPPSSSTDWAVAMIENELWGNHGNES